MAKLTKTSTPGIFRRHARGCGGGRCECAYVVVWRHRGKQHKETFRTFAEAREGQGNRKAGERRPTSRMKLSDYFDSWIQSYAGRTTRGFSETTRPEYRRPIEAEAVPRWGTWKLADVEPADVRDLFGAMRSAGKSTSAIKKTRAALSAMFATAVDDGLIGSNPIAGVRIPAARDDRPTDEKPKALSRAELGLFLAAVDDDWRLFFEFLTHTGLRISEAIGLTWENLDLGEVPRVKVREQFYKGQRKGLKSHSGRRDIPLSPALAERLIAHRRDSFTGADRPVFASGAGTELLPANVYRRVLTPAAVAVGMYVEVKNKKGKTHKRSTVSFHTFRHTCASLLFEAGRNVKQVQEWLGHADPGFTLRTYIHLMDEGVGDAEFFDDVLDGAGGNTGATGGPQTAVNAVGPDSQQIAV